MRTPSIAQQILNRSLTYEAVIPGRATGLVDRNGTPILDGDRIISYNHIAPGETYEDIKAGRKQPVPATVRKCLNGYWCSVADDGMSHGIQREPARYRLKLLEVH